MPAALLTTKEAADKLGTDPRSLRAFLRSRSLGVGPGKRYELAPDAIPGLKRDFATWLKAEESKRAGLQEARKNSATGTSSASASA